MYRRPESVLMVCILNIILGGLAVIGMLLLISGIDDEVPDWLLSEKDGSVNAILALASVDALTTFLCAVFMLQGEDGARWTYALEGVASSILYAVIGIQDWRLLVTASVYRVVCVTILFLPKANKFFRPD